MRPSLPAPVPLVLARASIPAVAMVMLSLAAAARTGPVALIGSGGAIAAVSLATTGGIFLYSRSVRIVIDAERVIILGPCRKRAVPRREVGGVALREIAGYWGRSQSLMLIYDREHRCIQLFDRRLWADEDVNRLQDSLCRHGRTRRHRTSFARMAAEFPGSARWWQLHGALVGASLVLVPTLVIVIVVAARC